MSTIVHPYTAAKDATSVNPIVHDYAYGPRLIPPKPSKAVPRQSEPAYRNQFTIVDPKAEAQVFDCIFSQTPSVTITPVELLSISPGMRKQMSDTTATKCVLTKLSAPTTLAPSTFQLVKSD